MVKGIGIALRGFGKALKSKKDWKEKRIDAMNRVGQKKVGGKQVGIGAYIEEYGNVTSSKAKNKKEYKKEMKKKDTYKKGDISK